MTIYCLGSINADLFYELPHLPGPGETLASGSHFKGLGGKGTNQSVAAAKAGSTVRHIGAVGTDGDWARQRLAELGVDVSAVVTSPEATGHAIILLDDSGENSIVLHGGANQAIPSSAVSETILCADDGDFLILQNETNAQADAARIAKNSNMTVVYSAAPFDVDAVLSVLPYLDILVMNEVENRQLMEALGSPPDGVARLVTKGAEGAVWNDGDEQIEVSSVKVTAVDTTGAGDTFAGYFVAGLDQGLTVEAAMKRASAAAALKVTKKGTADAIPSLAEVLAFQE